MLSVTVWFELHSLENAEVLLLVPVNMTLFGNGVFADDEVKMGSGRVGHREHAM